LPKQISIATVCVDVLFKQLDECAKFCVEVSARAIFQSDKGRAIERPHSERVDTRTLRHTRAKQIGVYYDHD
jgi:hypothetical protein